MKKKIDTKKRVEGIPATGEEIIENRESGFIAQESQVTKEFSSDESLKTDSLALSVCAKRKKPKDYRRVLTIAAIVLALVSGIFGIKFYFDYQAEQKALRLAELRATEEEKLAITLPKEFPSIEALSTYNTEELIQSYYGIKLTSDPKVLDTSTLGEKTIVYTITSEKYPDITKSFEVKVTVKDTTAPVLEGVENLSLTVGGSLDLLEALSASDNFDGDLKDKIEIVGDYDFNKAGTYDLQVVVSDSSGNSITQDFTLTVNKKVVVVDSSTSSGSSSGSSSSSFNSSPANYSNPIVAAAMAYVGGPKMSCGVLTRYALRDAEF